MSIRKRQWRNANGTITIKFLVDYRDQHGTRRFKQFAHKREAAAYRDKTGMQVRDGVHVPDAASVTVAQAGDRWLCGSTMIPSG
jgi:hypothetical protein